MKLSEMRKFDTLFSGKHSESDEKNRMHKVGKYSTAVYILIYVSLPDLIRNICKLPIVLHRFRL